MKKRAYLLLIMIILASCTTNSTIGSPSGILATLESKLTLTAIPNREIAAADVGLPWDPSQINGTVEITPCYLFTETFFHAGDIFYFPVGDSVTEYNVIAPADGTIVHANYINDAVGFDITVETSFLLDGKSVFYDVIHTSGLAPGLAVGSFVRRGDKLAIKKDEHLDPIGSWMVDIGFRNGLEQANASLPSWNGLGYFSYTRLLQDDLEQLTPDIFKVLPICNGNPIQQNIPYATPTLGGFTYP